jgi:hypothetical protein
MVVSELLLHHNMAAALAHLHKSMLRKDPTDF